MPAGFEILNDATLIIQNWLVSRLFANIFQHPNFIEEDKLPFVIFLENS